MKKAGIILIVILVIAGMAAVIHFGLFDFSGGVSDKLARIMLYEDTRSAPQPLLDLLSDKDAVVRARAALAVGRIGEAGTYEKLFNLITDSVSEVAESAVLGIGLSGNKEFARRLMRNCDIYSPDLLASTIQAVGFLGDSTMTDVIIALTDYLRHEDHRVREQAAYALFRCNAGVAAPQLKTACNTDAVRPVQVAALYALARMRVPADSLYAQWLPDSDPFVRALAVRGLALNKSDINTRLVAGALNDRDNNVVAQAIGSLGQINNPLAVEYLVKRYEGETDEKLKTYLIQTYLRLKTGKALEQAHEAIKEDSSVNVRAAALEYLSAIQGDEMLPLIDSLLDSADVYMTAAIASALGDIGGETVKPRLVTLYTHPSPMVRLTALGSLATVDSGNIDYYLETALKDTDYVVNADAVDYIGEHLMTHYLPQFMTIVQSSAGKVDLMRSVVAAVGKILENERNELAEEILYHALMNDNHTVSKDAAEVYREVLQVDKSAFINKPIAMVDKRKYRSFISKYSENPHAVIRTDKGAIELELYADIAPLTVYNFIKLASDGFYNKVIFHRVIPGFVAQGGDPRGDGYGGPGYEIRSEYSGLTFARGVIGMAHSGDDTGGSQFFIALTPQPHLDGRYTIFGHVVAGMDVVDKIVRGDEIEYISIRKASDKDDK
ncbi:MAG: peptidylprolyl isomerase [candidate division Zixibacteria bacterium]|nr:peptidylprolyl isomerase [candidate division Zixibacteria bacterium]